MRLTRVGVGTLAVGVLAALLSGCVVFKGPQGVKQIGDKPKAIVKFNVCLSDSSQDSVCRDMGNSEGQAFTGDWRMLVGLRVSKGAKPPASIEPKSVDFGDGSGTSATVLDRSASYTSELKQKAPGNPSKYKWAGYVSEPINHDDEAGFTSTGKFRIKLELKDKLIGEKLKVRPVLGSYQVSTEQPANAPIDCGDDPFVGRTGLQSFEDGDWAICIDDPARTEFRNLTKKIKG